MRDRRIVTVLVALVFAAGASALPVALTRPREVLVSTPGAAPLEAPATLPLARGRDVCVDAVALDPAIRTVRIAIVETHGQLRPPIGASVLDRSGRRLASGVVGGGDTGAAGDVDIPVRGRIGEGVGSVCLATDDPAEIELAGSNVLRTRSRSSTRVGGQTLEADLTLSLLGRPRTLAHRLGEVLRHAATFKPVGAWLIGVLGVLVALAVPLGLVAALRDALDSDGRP